MGNIFYIMGQSSSGKDTIYKKLLEINEQSLKTIIPYTTRPIRAGEKEGIEYHFVDEEQLEEIERTGKLIELRAYTTFHGIWKYFTVNDGQIDLTTNSYLMIGTLESYNKTREYYGKDQVIPILIELDDGVRLQRALDRERMQDIPKYQEMCRRFLADSVDFKEEKIREAGIARRFNNDDLERCLREIHLYIENIQSTVR